MKIRIAIADYHPLMIKGLQHVLTVKDDIEITGSYRNSAELLHGLARRTTDVLILDTHIPGQSIGELIPLIAADYPELRIVVLTDEGGVHHIRAMLRKGAAGFLLRSTDEDLLIDAVRTVHGGGQYLQPILREMVVQDMLQAKKQLSATPQLSEREQEVLRYISMDLTSQQIAEKIFVSKRTIDYYRLCLLTKLGVKNVGALIKKGMQLGYI